MVHIDAIVSKAAMIPEARRLAAIETRLYRTSIQEFERRAVPAVNDLVEKIAAGMAPNETALRALLEDFDKSFADLPATLGPFYQTATDEAYRGGRDAIIKKAFDIYPKTRDITYPSPHRFPSTTDEYETEEREKAKPVIDVIPSFSVVDEAAVSTLSDHQLFWIGNHYDEVLSNTIANTTVNAMVEAGFDREEGAKQVRKELNKVLAPRPSTFTAATIVPHGWTGSVAQYYEGLAANTMTVSRTFGALSGLAGVGAQTYRISNPVDERTCEVCGFLVGTSFSTSQGIATMTSALAVASPLEIKNIIRWDTLKKIRQRSGVLVAGPTASVAAASSLATAGYGMPSYHFRCRCVPDIGPATTFGVPLAIAI